MGEPSTPSGDAPRIEVAGQLASSRELDGAVPLSSQFNEPVLSVAVLRAPSLNAVRRTLGRGLAPMRSAVYQDKPQEPVVFMGYSFDCRRSYKAPGQVGYVWHYEWCGTPCTPETQSRWPTQEYGFASGNLESLASLLHERMRHVEAENGGRPWRCSTPSA